MPMLKKFARLFVIKSRWEAWAVIYAIALGAVERGVHYLNIYPGNWGVALAIACCGVVFLAGAKLLDAVRPPAPAIIAGPHLVPQRSRVAPAPRRAATDIRRRGSQRPRAASRR